MNINNKEIYLVRHGETMWNINGLAQGSRNDVPLNITGKEQSLLTGDYLNNHEQKYNNFDLVLCSPMIRARETANIICKKIGYEHNKIIYINELKEIDKGLISIGKSNNELKKDSKLVPVCKFQPKFMKEFMLKVNIIYLHCFPY